MIFHAFRWCDVDSGEVYVEGCGRWSLHDGLLDVAWFCVCKLGGSLVGGMNVGWVVVGESASALGDRRVLCESCRIRVISMHYIKSIGMCFEDDVT